ncbi:MAG: DNA topoisomerase III [Betaproteobacteria bacterium]|nr:DNA topoisomerase III [Betaproteobacteria bacterium]
MSKSLIIAEKPSVANDIAKALGGFARKDDYLESDDYVLSSAVGHLVEIGMPEEEEVKRGKWTFTHLPAIPSQFALKPIEKTEARLRLLLKLIKRKDVTGLINACDAGREGELIFRYIVQYAGAKKPIQRLWLQSMTPKAIKDGFRALREDEEMLPLAAAATCRSESDWLVGINGTRAMTAFNSKSGGFQLTTVGRVQTPTLAILVEREAKIKAFVPRDFWEVQGVFSAPSGEYSGKWFDEKFKKGDDEALRADRLWDEKKAAAIRAKCLGKPATFTEESKPTTQAPPLLFDLTSLQREANSRFGFSAKTTLSLAQALYEKHKVLTYPRTDSRALPEDYLATVKETLEVLKDSDYNVFAKRILDKKWVVPNKRIFDNSKISDHFAIIPTLQPPKSLNEIEAKLYDFVVKRFLAVFHPAAEFTQTTRITRVDGEPFKSEGKVLVEPGWLAVYGREAEEEGAANLPPLKPDAKVATEDVKVIANQTKPPARFSEATLLSAMEGAGKSIEDEELRAAMKEKGLGTPATRAAIIEGLIFEKYVHREGRELIPTAKAFSLMTLLHGLGVPELFSPELTANWEHQLALVEQGKLKREKFMAEIVKMTKHIVGQAKNYELDTIPGDFGRLESPCPKCGGEVHENYKKFQCQTCDFGFWKILAGRQLEPAEADALIAKREIGPIDGFRSRIGRAFSANLVMKDDFTIEFSWGEGGDDEGDEGPDFSGQEAIGQCPKCGNGVFESPNAYVCEKAVGNARTCDFRSGRVILKRPIERSDMAKLLATGKTDLLDKFISKKGRPFSAYLVKQKDGKIGFEFEERDPAKSKGRSAAPASAARVLGKHPGDGQDVTVHSGRYGPYVKHGKVNATIPNKDGADAITLDEAVDLLDAKAGVATTRVVKAKGRRAASAKTTTAAKKRKAA